MFLDDPHPKGRDVDVVHIEVVHRSSGVPSLGGVFDAVNLQGKPELLPGALEHPGGRTGARGRDSR